MEFAEVTSDSHGDKRHNPAHSNPLPPWCTLSVDFLLGSQGNDSTHCSSLSGNAPRLSGKPHHFVLLLSVLTPLSASLHSNLLLPLAFLPSLLHLLTPHTMPRERGKSKRGARNKSTLSRANRLTTSQRALIAHFASSRHSTQRMQSTPLQFLEASLVKLEATSSTTHFPPSPPQLHSPSGAKEETPPLGTHHTLDPYFLAPPVVKPGDKYYGDGSCKVEEEIPPSWQLDNITGTGMDFNTEADKEIGKEEEDQPHHFSNHLVEEHLQILFEIRQKQEDQVHSQNVINQRMNIMFEALSDAPASARCPMCSQRFTPAYTIHGQPGPAMD
jgi:hypothetical protein